MNFNKKLVIILIPVFLVIFLLFSLTISDNCKTLRIFKSFKSFGYQHIDQCYSFYIARSKIKDKFQDQVFLYSLSQKIYEKFIKKQGAYKLNLFSNIENEKKFFNRKKHFETRGILSNIQESELNTNQDNFEKIQDNKEFSTWTRSHGGYQNTKFLDSNNIQKNNLEKLKLKWKYSTINSKKDIQKWNQNIELNPVILKDNLIFVSADWQIISLNAESGKLNWTLQSLLQPSRRGVLLNHDEIKNKNFLYLPIGNRVYKIDADNGKRIKNFGENGSIKVSTITAPILYKEKLVIVSHTKKSVDIFDKNNGKKIDTIILHKERNFSGGSPWGGTAFDQKNGILFVNTGNPQPSLYGVHRPDDNLNSNSLIAIDINKNKTIWKFQETSHDLWDYDIPSPPILFDLRFNNEIIETVISLTKVGNLLYFERTTGKPIFDLNYKKIKKYSDVIGEVVADYQLDLVKPEKYHDIEYNKSHIPNHYQGKDLEYLLKNSKFGSYNPPSFKYDIIMKGLHGGAEWQGGALNPYDQTLFIPSNNIPWRLRPTLYTTDYFIDSDLKNMPGYQIYDLKCKSCHLINRNGKVKQSFAKRTDYIPSLVGISKIYENLEMTLDYKLKDYHNSLEISEEEILNLSNLFKLWDNKLTLNNKIRVEANTNSWSQLLDVNNDPLINPPWGEIIKMNLLTGKIEWKKPLGSRKVDGKDKQVGTPNFGGVALNNAGLIFATGHDDGKAYILSQENGDILWEYKMEAAGSAPPTLFKINGKEYVVFLSTGGGYHNYKEKSSTLYVFGIE